MADTNPSTPSEPYSETAATHIRSLSTLTTRLPTLLTTTATSVSQLTNQPIAPATLPATTRDTPAQRRTVLSQTANAFFTTVLELNSALHAQIDDLEKHGVVPAEEVKYRAVMQTQGAKAEGGAGNAGDMNKKDSQASVTNNGLGGFDVGILNARAGVRHREGEEVWKRVQEVLRGLAEGVEGDVKVEGDEEMKDG
ncbi:hypothetical protein P280DRAFT_315741 [Massarina eburnea CBS 473.64]|uniref:Mediator of RNA polymerase II transcription subunit 11 n=1 Tax=Massarina eburnea CBS 473.64 TaxID=1395130 RepID=A0A6A6S529_9PLEO|nr:hypothetical protein P280DRAFT_315741 [Massarina eburnea CBS 473.64]